LADLDALLKTLGVSPQRRVLEHMLYEVDELADDVICWQEFQLTYYRNVNDATGDEPSSFFRIIEFLTFDPLHRGLAMEDDVMEVSAAAPAVAVAVAVAVVHSRDARPHPFPPPFLPSLLPPPPPTR